MSWAHAVEAGTWVRCPVRCIVERADGQGGQHMPAGEPVPLSALAHARVVDPVTLCPTDRTVVDPADRSTWEDLERVPNRGQQLRDDGWWSTVSMY